MNLTQRLKIISIIICLIASYGCQTGKSNSQSSGNNNVCPDLPQGTLDSKDVKAISISNQPAKESGTVRVGQNLGYTFDAKVGDKLSWRTNDNVCVWIFTPTNKPLKSGDLPDAGKYLVQVSVASGTTTFTLEMGIGNTVASSPIAATSQPTNTPTTTASGSSLSQDQATSIVQNWLNAKKKVFAPPFDRQLARQLTTGLRYNQIMQPGGSIDWLVANNSYYTYAITRVDNVWAFDNSKSLVEIKLRITEDLTLHNSNGGIDPESSSRTTANYIYYLAQDNGTWKIHDSKKTSD
jgi:hypothetical protein